MSEREYPREWFRVSRWGSYIEARTFVRETAAKLVCEPRPGLVRMIAKESRSDKWYPTREEAEARRAEIAAANDAAKADKLLRDAAAALYEALEALFADYKELADSGDAGFWSLEDTDIGKQALAALAQAKVPNQ